MKEPQKAVLLGTNERIPPGKEEERIMNRLVDRRNQEIHQEAEQIAAAMMTSSENQKMEAEMKQLAERRGELESYQATAEIDSVRRARLLNTLTPKQ